MRRRICKEYSWSGGAWVMTNSMFYVYDGNLVVQERDGSDSPQVTYTRGRDLSGTPQGAGGIGGLLARSQLAAPIAQTAFYFCDANGNVTALITTNQLIAAKYSYDPFGGTTSQGGPLASANIYRFSSKEFHANSGMYYYLYRFYDPGLQRWINRDPIEEKGGINVYSYIGNAPVTKIDPLGLTCASNWKFFWSWAMGGGQQNRYYGPNTTETKEMENSPGGNKLRDAFYKNGCKNVNNFGYGTGEAAADTLLSPSETCWQVGGFGGATAIDNGNGTVTFTIPNVAGTHSFFYHIVPNVPNQINLPLAGPINTPGRSIFQTFQWSERIDRGKCKCAKK
jgi:RHS repeat-associated protein